MHRIHFLLLLLLPVLSVGALSMALLATPLVAGTFTDAASAKANYNRAKRAPKHPCGWLNAASTSAYSVIRAQPVAATASVPTHCRVKGIIPLEVGFEFNFPAQWNGRLYMYGNGGLAGTPADNPGKRAMAAAALAQGFATAYTDTGHDRRVEVGGTFAHNKRHALVDWGYRAVHLSVVAAKDLANEYYGRAPQYSYFHGCSTGGRQGLMAAQRFPGDFDGILAGAPAGDYSGLKFSQAWRVGALKETPLTQTEVLQLAKHIYAKCDALDGLSDGLLDDPRSCDFEPSKDLPLCAGPDTDSCFDTAEITALERIYAPVMLAGQQVYPAYPVGSEVAGPTATGGQVSGWVPWLLNESGPVLLDLLGSDFFRYMAFIKDDASFDWTEFDFAQAPDNLEEFREIVDAVNPDLTPFAQQGGKLISYFGWADPDINPLTILGYRDAVAAQLSEPQPVDEFFRVFMVPGMFHCSGGPGPSDFDAMTPLIDWVEKAQAPQRIRAAHRQQGREVYSRPLCAYPQRAVLSEATTTDTVPRNADQFICRK